ncbi:xanthine dehydrogenase family protein molybdopterin-binding subunit [Rhizobacter sp. Root404]|uniref:xanthine dehydrogenase family protein molybdopterin-binding subunit n=1 Tax=Rhizobacter sp. Root404 TaxID=1736528 RepID=UPI0006FC823B|nr:molybdopterin cofactor-binding domain-containing protein [Rhizobacter sp. Root404]KQW38980.1 acylaldehyde oxidase [Rhizobacter sp. Root404]
MKRRTLLLSGLGAAGALVVGWGVLPPRGRLGSADSLPVVPGEVGLNGWIKVAEDGTVVLAMHRSEMGQGVHTALAMLVAEELDISLAKLRLQQAGPDALYGNVAGFVASLPFHPADTEAGHETTMVKSGQWIVAKLARELGINMTGGSSTVADAWDVLRLAAATARAQLLGAASLAWKLPVAELGVKNGVVSHASGPQGHYGLFAKAAAATPPGDVVLKAPKDWTLIGTAAPRIDLAAKVDGSAQFGIDVRLPGQLYAVVRHSPMLGGAPGAVRVEASMALPGVERVVRLGPVAGSTAALAVVGRTYWHAQRGAQALQVEWQAPPAGTVSSAAIAESLARTARSAAATGGGTTFHSRGDVTVAAGAAARQVEQLYSAPYLAHAPMEPINCTARVADGKVEVWVPTQVPGAARALAARVAGVAPDAVTVHVTYLGGGFGRRLDVDVVGQAVRVAMETGGRPVQLVWPREEDLTHDFYRPAGVALLQASLDATGMPTALRITSAGDAITPRWMERSLPALAGPIDMPDKTAAEGLIDLPYGIPNQRMAHVATHSGVPVGFWRSVGHSHNAFFSEGFIDELAHEARQDPVAFRLALLAAAPRHAAVLRLAAEKAGWGQPLPAGVARGVALHDSFNSIVAQVVEVSMDGGRPRVRRVVCAADVGTVVNPGIVAQQMESGILFGLSAALYGRIDIDASVVRQTNFPTYPVVRLAETPRIETHLVPSTRSPGGVGEPGTPPIAPAVANAMFVLTGRRVRSLPLVA